MSILAPLSTKRVSFEFLCLATILSLPALHFSWSFPTPATSEIMGDKLSMILVFLSIWTSILMTFLKPTDKFLNLNIILLLWSLAFFFMMSSFLMFFILFEASLIPTLCLVMGWGYQPERLEASYYFIFYTVMFSIPLLASLIWLVSVSGSKYFFFDDMYEVCGILGFFVLSVFMIKLPLFMVHFWLPKAHVEAPVVGSMILAGVLLKTGGYGIVRVFSYMYKTLTSSGYMALSSIGMVYVCFVCLYCVDLKQLIAFSSVSHMNFMIVGLMNNSLVSSSGALFMMVSHGICSSLMFMLADFSYKRSGSRSILVMKGLLVTIPTLALLWSISVLFNMGVPPSVGSLSELLVITASAKTLLFKVAFGLYLFLSAFYSVFLYMVVNHGNSMMLGWNLEVKEILASLAHLLPLTGLTLITKLMLM